MSVSNGFTIYTRARNPLYGRSARLVDIEPGVEIITLNNKTGSLRFTLFTTGWEQVPRRAGTSCYEACLIANDQHDDPVNLSGYGIHPYQNGVWDSAHFSVHATAESVRFLHSWLRKRSYPRARRQLEDRYPAFINGLDDSFWNCINQQIFQS